MQTTSLVRQKLLRKIQVADIAGGLWYPANRLSGGRIHHLVLDCMDVSSPSSSFILQPLFIGRPLQALVKKLERKSISLGRPQGIFHARVPIVKFVDAASGQPPPRSSFVPTAVDSTLCRGYKPASLWPGY